MNLKTAAAAVYATLQALHAEVGDTPEMVAHHEALNEARKLLADWSDFLLFIGEEPEAARSGGTPKDNNPPPPGGAG